MLTKVECFPTERFTPTTQALVKARTNASDILHLLRQTCASYILQTELDRNDAIWIATVRNDEIKNCRLLTTSEVRRVRQQSPRGRRLGLIPADLATQLRNN